MLVPDAMADGLNRRAFTLSGESRVLQAAPAPKPRQVQAAVTGRSRAEAAGGFRPAAKAGTIRRQLP
jgi:hypothetical protein